jgi:hypothetical protein
MINQLEQVPKRFMIEFLKGFWYGWASDVAASLTKPEQKEGIRRNHSEHLKLHQEKRK